MDLRSSLRKSSRHSRRISAGAVEDIHLEHQPILSSNDHHAMNSREVIVRIDSGDNNKDASQRGNGRSSSIRGSSYDFWGDNHRRGGSSDGFEFQRKDMEVEEPPLRLIRGFIDRQKEGGGDMQLDMDMDMEELRNARSPSNITPKGSLQSPHNISPVAEIPVNSRNRNNNDVDNSSSNTREVRVLFQDELEPTSEVSKCSYFQQRANNLKMKKTQSRLSDSKYMESKCGKGSKSDEKGANRRSSAFTGRLSGKFSKPDDDEDDSLLDEDIPDNFMRNKLDALTLLQWFSLIIIATALISTLAVRKWKWTMIHGLAAWEWEVLVFVLICGRLVSGWGIRIVVFFIERNFLLRKRVLYFVYGLRKAVQNCIWLGLVLLAWHCLFDKKVDGNNKVLAFVNQLMFCMLVASLIWLLKTLMVKVLASSFHVSTFFDRIQESLFNQYVIETLSGPPLVEIQNIQKDKKRQRDEILNLKKAGVILPPELEVDTTTPQIKKTTSFSRKQADTTSLQDDGISIDELHKLNTKNVSAWNMKRLMKIVRHGFRSTLDEQILNTTQEDEYSTEIRSELEAKIAARKIFRNVARPKSNFICMEDLRRFLREEEAFKTMTLLEGSPDGISKAVLKNWVVNAFRERRALALTLNDTKTAVKKLHHMVNVIVSILILIICLVILEIATSKYVVALGSQIILVAFIFGNTCKQIFEAIIFLFSMHPFDVGDRCEIDGVQLIVEEMNILTTVFLRGDNLKVIYPNSTLATKPISNYYRSPDMGDSVDFAIHIGTPNEKIVIMKERIISYIEGTPDHWYTAPSVVLMQLEELNHIKMSVWMRHKMNHQDMGERWMRRARLVEEMVKIFKDLGIDYHPRDINICNIPAVSSNRLPPWPSASQQHVQKSESVPPLDNLKTQ